MYSIIKINVNKCLKSDYLSIVYYDRLNVLFIKFLVSAISNLLILLLYFLNLEIFLEY